MKPFSEGCSCTLLILGFDRDLDLTKGQSNATLSASILGGKCWRTAVLVANIWKDTLLYNSFESHTIMNTKV